MSERNNIINFVKYWSLHGDEKSDEIKNMQTFWLTLLRDVFDIEKPENFFDFNHSVSYNGRTLHADAFVMFTRVLIEHKSSNKNLFEKLKQSDGELLTPYEQALRYVEGLQFSEQPRWIVTCNFKEFHVYNFVDPFTYLEPPSKPDAIIKLEELPNEYKRLNFLVDPKESITEQEKISKKAVDIVKKIRKSFEKFYSYNKISEWHKYLYKICTRLVFCFYADDSHLFNAENYFTNYLKDFSGNERVHELQKVFDILDTPENLRENFSDKLKKFPYVNGGLFKEKITFPSIAANVYDNPVNDAFVFNISRNFSWRMIDTPTFGAMFEDALNPSVRRQGGMHYTSRDNIHKVIDPLFLDELNEKLKHAKQATMKNRLQKLKDFQSEIAALTFFDPACGSGNFLTETYISLRELENKALKAMRNCGGAFDENPVKVSIENFFGIEINGYACAIAQVALWIAENQMLQKTEGIVGKKLQELPLKTYPHITCANALQIDWSSVVPKDKLNFIIGNPPFVGYTYQSAQQKADLLATTKLNNKKIDYVVSWYYKAAEFITGTKIECAFVSTNSITQGEQVAAVWKNLPVKINFAHKTFKWSSESDTMAAVHCVVIGFAMKSRRKKFIIDGEQKIPAKNINAYLIDAPDVFIASRNKAICDVPKMVTGNRPADGGNLIVEADDYDKFNCDEKNFIKKFMGAEEFINGKKRYCLWLGSLSLDEIKKFPHIAARVEACRKDRLKGAADRKLLAATPHLFREILNPKSCVLIPSVSSENRNYIPIGFLNSDVIASNLVLIIPDAGLYEFGVLTSSVHMAWTRVVCGRLKSDYRYSKDIVYNNFIWCEPTGAQKKLIEETAQKILDVRADFAGKTLAFLYGEDMPAELREAHKKNDRAVMAAYGFDETMKETEIVAALMNLYKEKIS